MPGFRRTSNRGSFSRGRQRQTEWSLCSVPTGYSLIAANTKVLLVLFPVVTLAAESPATIVRTRGTLSVKNVDAAGDNDIAGAFGCGLVNSVAGALGVTGIPGPATNCDWPGWYVWQPFLHSLELVSGVGFDSNFDREYVIDSKAQRKFEDGQALAWVIENNTAVAFEAAVSLRTLVKAG